MLSDKQHKQAETITNEKAQRVIVLRALARLIAQKHLKVAILGKDKEIIG